MARNALRIVALLTALLVWPRPAVAAPADWPDSLTIGTAAPGGTYAAYGDGLASVLGRHLGIAVSARHTDGPNENIALLEAGEIQLAFVTLGVALQAWNGTGAWTKGRQFRAMRALFPMYDTTFHFVAPRDSGVQSIADLAGKRVGVGPEGGTTSTYMPEFLKALNLDATAVVGEWSDLGARMQDRGLDGLVVAAGAPFPTLLDLERKGGLRFLPLTAKQVLALRLAMPELGASVIPPGLYVSLRTRYETVGLYNFAVARRDLPASLVYAIMDAVFANHERLIEAHPAAAETVPANFTRNTFLPFHDGASQWYRNLAASGATRGD